MKKLIRNTKTVLACVKDNDYEDATMIPEHMSNRKITVLPQFEVEINDYLSVCQGVYSKTQQHNIKYRCTYFMRFLQNRGLVEASELGYEDILSYHEGFLHKKRINRMLYESSIKLFLSHLASKGICSYGLGWFLHYVQSDRVVSADTVENILSEIPNSKENLSLLLSAKEYWDLSDKLLGTLKEEHLSRNIIAIYENTFKLHFVFLDINGLVYNSARAAAWTEACKGILKSSWPTMRRAMRLFDDHVRTGVLVPGKAYTSKPNEFDLLPQWCKGPMVEFVGQREKAKMSPSTTKMDLSSCVRFCAFLSKEGIGSFKDVTAANVKEFNVRDRHHTAGGKGAYNSRIRKFLKFLARDGYVANTSLYQALSGPAASSEHIVITLNETEKEDMKAFNASAETELEQRDKACVLLGTEMGIRGCDIVNLRFSDINWKERSIRFQQKKTGTEVWLAMPISVGNAIYHYLKDCRPKEAKCDYIFVTARAPYRKLTPLSCGQALHRILPERKVAGSGFHVTRKTFATERLRNNVCPDQIANAMGHATLDSINPYLSLDDERMRLCPLSVEDLGFQIKGGFGNG